MNCLRMSPGTVRKTGAILRKCSAQALRSILDGRRYWTIAVIMGRTPPRNLNYPSLPKRAHSICVRDLHDANNTGLMSSARSDALSIAARTAPAENRSPYPDYQLLGRGQFNSADRAH